MAPVTLCSPAATEVTARPRRSALTVSRVPGSPMFRPSVGLAVADTVARPSDVIYRPG